MRIKRFVFVVALTAGLFIGVGCSGDNPGVGPTPVPNPTPSPSPSPQPGPGMARWEDFGPISEAAKQLIIEGNLKRYGGAITRWADGSVVRTYGDGFPREEVAMVAEWEKHLSHARIRFETLNSSAGQNVLFSTLWPPPNQSVPETACGAEGPNMPIVNHVITGGAGYFAFNAKPNCGSSGGFRIGLAHGMGHILWLGAHTPDGVDIMGSPRSIWAWGQVLIEATIYVYKVPPATRLPF